MIEIGRAVTGNPPVVEQPDRMPGDVLFEARGGVSLGLGSLRPALGALGLLDHVSQDRAEQAEFLARAWSRRRWRRRSYSRCALAPASPSGRSGAQARQMIVSEAGAIAAKSPAASRSPQDWQWVAWSSRTRACRALGSTRPISAGHVAA